jgi:Ca2+-transporting ATPase
MIHLPLVITAAVIPLVGYPLLYLPIHIVWLEMIIHPTALLVFQDLPPDDHLVRRKHEPRLRFFDRWQWLSIVLVGTTILVVVTASYVRSLGAGYEVEHARAMALVALTVASAGITASLSKLRSLTAKLIVGLTILVSVVLVQVPGLAALLHLKPLHFDDWAIAVAGGLLAAVIPAVQRQFENRHLPRHRAHP